MTDVMLWLLCGLPVSMAFIASQRKFIRGNTNEPDSVMFLGIILVGITIGGPISLACLCVGHAAKSLAKLIP